MIAEYESFKDKLCQISRHWISSGLPSHQALESTADHLEKWKRKRDIPGLWPDTPLMLTATLDDGIGQGISIIERYAGLAGLEVQRIGLLQYPGFIVEKCHILRPALLGLTVLQLDSDDALAEVGRNRPSKPPSSPVDRYLNTTRAWADGAGWIMLHLTLRIFWNIC